MRSNRRASTLILLISVCILLIAIILAGESLSERAMAADFSRKDLAPCPDHPFGTDWMGRDMLARTLAGLSLSIRVGALTAAVSAAAALVLGTASALLGGRADGLISWFIDLVMGVPHILLIILISLACGRGFWGVVAGVSLSHWPALARVLRGEALKLRQAPFCASPAVGLKSWCWNASWLLPLAPSSLPPSPIWMGLEPLWTWAVGWFP